MQMDLLSAEPESGTDRPIRELLDEWLPAELLRVRQGSLLREIELIDDRFLRVELTTIPAHLPENRLRCLDYFITEAGKSWPHARLAISKESGSAFAETDLENSSRNKLREFLPVAVQTLRWVVVALAETAEFLADPAVSCEALERKEFLPEADSSAGRQNQKPNKK